MEIIKIGMIESPLDILGLDFIDFNRLNGHWNNPKDALNTIFSWFKGCAIYTIVSVPYIYDIPDHSERFPKWEHCGNHISIGKLYWNWFCEMHPSDKLVFSDAPDFHGTIGDNLFWGDINKVSASTFALTQKGMNKGDLWISVYDGGESQLIIECLNSINERFCSSILGEL